MSNHRFLALRVRAAGHPRTRGSYFVSIQTEGLTNDDLWQQRLYFSRDEGGEDVFARSFFFISFLFRFSTTFLLLDYSFSDATTPLMAIKDCLVTAAAESHYPSALDIRERLTHDKHMDKLSCL